jgi:Transposase and inactivated derivatives
MSAEVLYDNTKVVVLERSSVGRRYNPGLLDLAGRYGFAPRLCRPYRARIKGKVERSIGYLRGRFFTGRRFRDLEDLNAQLLAWLDGTANRRCHATTGERPLDRLAAEGLAPYALAPAWPGARQAATQRAPLPGQRNAPLVAVFSACSVDLVPRAALNIAMAVDALTGLPELMGIFGPSPRRFPCSERFRRL